MNALGFREIKAWSDLREISLLPWQLDAILALDLTRRVVEAEKPDANGAVAGPGKMSELFPAVRTKRVDREGKMLN